MRASAIVVAAGEGSRMGGPARKAYLSIAGRPLVLRTLDRVCAASTISEVILVVAEADLESSRALLAGDERLRGRRWILQGGGATRQQSVRHGLERVSADCDVVVVHDGARPLATADLIDRCARKAAENGATVAGLPVRDTIKRVGGGGKVEATLPRGSLWEIQTPQAFRRDLIVEAHFRAAREGWEATDDAALVERMGAPVYVIEGERANIKVTVPEDLRIAEALLAEEARA